MISEWLVGALGTIGTAAALLVVALGYFIWQFNPAFNLPQRKNEETELERGDEGEGGEEGEVAPAILPGGKTINDLYNEQLQDKSKGNSVRATGPLVINKPAEDAGIPEFTVIEKRRAFAGYGRRNACRKGDRK